ncbi:stalk domain-containing protein [Heyndrickxia sp. MSNUG]|uniref:stalk domain-containing protein n=1 Tax=Heyndrickxia sp. MSNUG TaxID=3136677 RepID=UPI003C2DAF46
MKKVSVLILSVLFIFLSVTVVWQWIIYSNHTSQVASTPDESITQSVTVKVGEKGLTIKQVFKNLQNGSRYGAIIPEQASELVCKDSEGVPCQNDLETQSIKAKGDDLQFEYFIKSDSAAVEYILNDWLVSFSEREIASTRIEIVDRIHRKGTWVAGLPLKGYRQMEVVKYYVFEGLGENPSLYWQNRSLEKFSSQKGIQYYSNSQEQPGIYKFDSLKGLADKNHLSVIFNSENRNFHGNGLLLAASSLSKNELEQQLAISFLSQKIQGLGQNNKRLLEALASLIIKQPASNPKSQGIVKELQTKLTAEEINDFTLILAGVETSIDYTELNDQLAAIKGMETKFFTLNKQDESGLYPLLFNDGRRLIVNGQKIMDWDILLEGDSKLFPLIKTMSSLGNQTNVDSRMTSIEVTSNNSKYSFNLKNNTFVMNGKNFGLLENPFKIISGTVYIEGHWLQALFKVSVDESEEEIALSL